MGPTFFGGESIEAADVWVNLEGFPLNKKVLDYLVVGALSKHDLPGCIFDWKSHLFQQGFSEERLWPDNYLVSWLEVS